MSKTKKTIDQCRHIVANDEGYPNYEAMMDREFMSKHLIDEKILALYLKDRSAASDSNKGLRFNDGKRKWSLVHFKSIEPLVEVLEFGAKKYAPENWKKGLDQKEILESMQRHIAAVMDGEKNDPESGISQMGHIMCNAMFYVYFENENKLRK